MNPPNTGRPPLADEAQLKHMADALRMVSQNPQEYRAMRRSFAVALNCTERAVELMVKRWEKKKAESGETNSAEGKTQPIAAEKDTPARSA